MGKPDMAKERRWREVLRRFEASDLGTRRFCARERIPEHQFHWWRRRLRQSCQHAPPSRDGAPQRGLSHGPSPSREVGSSARGDAPVGGSMPPHDTARRSRPVAPANTTAAPESPFWSMSAPLTLSAPLEVVHPRGHVIRVPALFDAAALERLLAVLDRADPAEAPR